MGSLEVVVAVVAATFIILAWVRRNRITMVPKRGLSIGADLGSLADKPRVRVQAVSRLDHERVHVALALLDAPEGSAPVPTLELGFTVALGPDEFAFGILQEWVRTGEPLGVVMPAGSTIVRLRSIGDLQPITLKRMPDEGDEP
jgi:hypothetical protein